MTEYTAIATDSAGQEFVLGTTDDPIRALAYLKSNMKERLMLRTIVVRASDGTNISDMNLEARAGLALQGLARGFDPPKPSDGEAQDGDDTAR